MSPEKSLTFWQKYVKPTLDPILENPKLTPFFLFALAVVPLLTVALVLGLIFLSDSNLGR